MKCEGAWRQRRPATWRNLPGKQATAGHSIGIVCIPGVSALLPGNMQNASTFSFPVEYKVVRGVTFDQIACGAPEAAEPIVAAARELVAGGARAVVGACGSLGHYQRVVADAVPRPVFMSIMTQVPFILQAMGMRQKLAILFATKRAFTPLLREQCGIPESDRIISIDLMGCPEFDSFVSPGALCDGDALLKEVFSRVEAHIDNTVGALLLQCSDLPPFAADLQQHFGLPVFDMSGLVEWLHSSVVRRPFPGFL